MSSAGFLKKILLLCPGEEPFLGFVDYFMVSFDSLIHLEAFWHLSNLFGEVQKKKVFLECRVSFEDSNLRFTHSD